MHRAAADRARQAEPERLRRAVQWPAPGRVPERTLVRLARSRSRCNRGLATAIQQRATEEVTGRADARAVRNATGLEANYNAGKLLINLLLKAGGRRLSVGFLAVHRSADIGRPCCMW